MDMDSKEKDNTAKKNGTNTGRNTKTRNSWWKGAITTELRIWILIIKISVSKNLKLEDTIF